MRHKFESFKKIVWRNFRITENESWYVYIYERHITHRETNKKYLNNINHINIVSLYTIYLFKSENAYRVDI